MGGIFTSFRIKRAEVECMSELLCDVFIICYGVHAMRGWEFPLAGNSHQLNTYSFLPFLTLARRNPP